ncbi:MAG: PQQ-binding-like beta-propeller repeat protein [Dehalococcoidia bacterium]|nr:PQQ-binding-like beta-propeller repeat protein [Dehalococcoidia bacterium]
MSLVDCLLAFVARLREAITLLAATWLLASPSVAFADSPGDWPMPRHDPANTAYNSNETNLHPPFRLRWRDFFQSGPVRYAPVASEGTVYVVSGYGHLYAIDTATGTIEWDYEPGRSFSGPPVVANGIIYIASSYTDEISALDAQSGVLRWSFPTSRFLLSSPLVGGGVLYIRTDGGVLALDAASGSPRWTFSIKLTSDTVVGSSFLALADGLLFAGSIFSDGTVYALDALTGDLRWTYAVSDYLISPPSVAGGTLYFAGLGKIYALDTLTGSVRWVQNKTYYAPSSPAMAGGIVYVGLSDGTLYALDAGTGGTKWTYHSGTSEASPIVANGLVYVQATVDQGYNAIVALDTQTGEQKGDYTWSADHGTFSPPAVSNGVLYAGSRINVSYVGTGDGALYALENDVSIPNLSISNTTARDRVYSGEALTYLIALENSASTGISAVVTDTVPNGTSVISGTLTGGAVYSPTINAVLWSGTVPPGLSSSTSQVIDFRVSVSDTITRSVLYNTLAVSSGDIAVTRTIATRVWRRTFAPLASKGSTGW